MNNRPLRAGCGGEHPLGGVLAHHRNPPARQFPLPIEVWLPVVGFEGSYEVSNMGRVRSLDRTVLCRDGRTMHLKGVVLKPQLHNGYLTVCLSRPPKRGGTTYVHVLVLNAFRGPCPDGMQCCHYNDVRDDNRLVNLRWDTPEANYRDRVRNDRLFLDWLTRTAAEDPAVARQIEGLVHADATGRWSR